MHIISTGETGIGSAWMVKLNEKELKTRVCEVCRDKIEVGQAVYVCEVCKRIYHKMCLWCGSSYMIDLSCKHGMDYTHICGMVIKEG